MWRLWWWFAWTYIRLGEDVVINRVVVVNVAGGDGGGCVKCCPSGGNRGWMWLLVRKGWSAGWGRPVGGEECRAELMTVRVVWSVPLHRVWSRAAIAGGSDVLGASLSWGGGELRSWWWLDPRVMVVVVV